MIRPLRSVPALLAGTVVASALALAPAAAPADAAPPTYHPWAQVHEKDARLRLGCHTYHYTYKATAPTDEWSIQLTLRNPNRHDIASAYFDSGSDPVSGRRSWRLCSNSTVVGRYRISTLVTYQEGYTQTIGKAKPVYFQLHGPRQRPHHH